MSNPKVAFSMAESLSYEYCPADRMLFEIGEKGFKYFIVIKGSLLCLIKKDEEDIIPKEREKLNLMPTGGDDNS